MRLFERDDKKVLYYGLENGRTLAVQPHGSPICGQCAMAMIADVSVQEIVSQLYSEQGTTYIERDAILSKYMDDVVTVTQVDNRKAIDLSGTGVLALQFGRSNTGHAIAFDNGVLYDPAGRVYEDYKEMKAHYNKRGRKIRAHAITKATPREYATMKAASDY